MMSSMIEMLITLLVIAAALGFTELLVRNKIFGGELSRKFIHIVVGTFIATWAYYLTKQQIQILSALLLVGVVMSQRLKVFNSVHGISRRTLGEPLFAFSVGMVATFATQPWIYAVAILHMSLADGFAAIIGTKFGKSNGYSIFGQHKTIIGSMTFFVISSFIVAFVILAPTTGISSSAWPLLVWLPILATLTENLAVYGIDNIAVPLLVMACLEFALITYN